MKPQCSLWGERNFLVLNAFETELFPVKNLTQVILTRVAGTEIKILSTK